MSFRDIEKGGSGGAGRASPYVQTGKANAVNRGGAADIYVVRVARHGATVLNTTPRRPVPPRARISPPLAAVTSQSVPL